MARLYDGPNPNRKFLLISVSFVLKAADLFGVK